MSIERTSVPSCSLRARSRPRHPRRARRTPDRRVPARGSGWLRALSYPSLRAAAREGRGRWATDASGGVLGLRM